MHRRARNPRRIPSPLTIAALLGLGTVSALSTACSSDAEAAAEAEVAPAAASSAPVAPTHYDPRQSLAPMLSKVGPAVVAVDAGRSAPRGFFGSDSEGAVQGRGSGFIVDDTGLVVTNHHVIDGATTVKVRLPDDRRFDARVVGSDPATDLAVLQLEGAHDLPVVSLGQSSILQVGDWVVAMGNPMGLDHSATVGIISGKGRGSMGLYRDSYLDFLQTDADIAPGSSGGPLFNLRGEVVGINTAVGAGLRPGFAIPIDQAKRIVEQLRDRGHVTRGWLGASNKPGARGRGAAVGSVYGGTPAEAAGLRSGDVVVSLDGESIEDFEALRSRIATRLPGDDVELEVERDGERLKLTVTLEARPEGDSLERLRPSRGGPSLAPESREAPESRSTPSFRLPFGLGGPSERTAPEAAPEPAPGGALRLGIRVRWAKVGVEVVDVEPGSLGATLGLEAGDHLLEIDGKSLGDPQDVKRALAAGGDRLELRYERGGAKHHVTFDR
ncbi:MAG: trypsin-like peptidase domain-containing protein [Myxococcota bacterium]